MTKPPVPVTKPCPIVEPLNVFHQCIDDILKNKVIPIQSKILKMQSGSNEQIPKNYVMKIPDQKYKNAKRASVFHKVDINAFDLDTIPEYKKSEEEI